MREAVDSVGGLRRSVSYSITSPTVMSATPPPMSIMILVSARRARAPTAVTERRMRASDSASRGSYGRDGR
ncbi:hypothetical protein [Streptomyces sp. NPDC085540]|uniref:hypothetical protein n=1 Tax=Streptomyces sp. NPDC085540 TaxID=3365730 RepID=UPI0037CF21A2